MRNYSIAFRKEGKTAGFAEVARTQGEAIAKILAKTDYEVEDLLDVREVFGASFHDKFIPS